MIYTIELIQKSLNPNLTIEGVVFTMYDARTNLSLQVVEKCKIIFESEYLQDDHSAQCEAAEAPSHGMPITVYDSRSTGAESYRLWRRK